LAQENKETGCSVASPKFIILGTIFPVYRFSLIFAKFPTEFFVYSTKTQQKIITLTVFRQHFYNIQYD